MIFLIFLLLVIAILLWLLLVPVELLIDSRVPIIRIRIRSMGNVSIEYAKEDFWLRTQIFFLHFNWRISELRKKQKIEKPVAVKRRKFKPSQVLGIMAKIIGSMKVKRWELCLHPDDYTLAAQLYPLNFIPLPTQYKITVNFSGESYLLIKIVTAPWRIVYSWIRK